MIARSVPTSEFHAGAVERRIRVGLFLSGEPTGGGKFQYSMSLLESLVPFAPDRFELVGAAESPLWEEVFSDRRIPFAYVPTAGWTDRWRRLAKALRLPHGFRRKLARSFDPQARKMAKLKCDLWIFPSHDEAAAELPFHSLVSVHDLMHRYEPDFPEIVADGQYEAREDFFRRVCATADGILVDSRVGKKQVAESYGYPSDRIYVLPYIPYTHPSSDRSLDSFELPDDFIFYPAQFWKHKNHENLVSAIALLRDRGTDVHLVLVGSKKNGFEQLIRMVEELRIQDRVHFLGYVPDEYIPALYRRGRAMVMPTFLGPTNIPQLEAFVYGCPVATSAIYGIPEQVGDAALLFDPRSVDEIADAIERLWQDDVLRETLRARGFAHAEKWNARTFGARLAEIIERLLEESRSSEGIDRGAKRSKKAVFE